jgi:hypothetical protein
MTVQNRETVGTLHCKTCETEASLHQTARGKKRLLYKRCGCGCDQRTGAAIQKKWAQEMTPRQGFEHLKQERPESIEEPKTEPETTETEPMLVEKPEPAPQVKGAGFMPVFGALCGLGLLLLTAGGSSGGLS